MAELDLTRVSFRNMTFEAICDFEIVEGLWPIPRQSFLEIHTQEQPPPIPVQDCFLVALLSFIRDLLILDIAASYFSSADHWIRFILIANFLFN